MYRSRRYSIVARIVLAALFVVLLAACRVEEDAQSDNPGVDYPELTAEPFTHQVDVPTQLSGGTPATGPAQGSPTPQPAPTQEGKPFTLTILHTGEVYGEVRPCG